MKLKSLAVVLFLFCLCGRVSGVEVSGELRYRAEGFQNYNLYEKQRKDEASKTIIHFTRLDLKAEKEIGAGMSFTGQLRGSLAQGNGNAETAFKPGDTARIHQAYLDFSDPLGKHTALRVGRQEMNYGGGLLIGPDDWDNTGNSFDAVKFTSDGDTVDYDLFAARVSDPHTAHKDGYFAGMNVKKTGTFRDTSEFSIIYRSMPYLNPATRANLRFFNFGYRLQKKAAPGLLFNALANLQKGSVLGYNLVTPPAGRLKHKAYNYMLNLDYFADKKVFRNFGVEYSVSTGDKSPTDSTHETYYPIYPSDHSRFGAMDWFGNMNSEIFTAYTFYDVTPKIMGLVEFHRFRLNSGNAAWYLGNGKAAWLGPANFFPRNANAPRNAGTELDLLWKINAGAKTSFHVGYSMFVPADLFKDVRWWNKSNKVRWAYFQAVIRL